MFAVKGWNVDASTLKPQIEVFKAKTDGEGGKKRKRDHREAQTKKEKKRLKREKDAENDPNKVALGERKPRGGEEDADVIEGGSDEKGVQQGDADVDDAVAAKKSKKQEKKERQKQQKQEQQSARDKALDAKSKSAPKSEIKAAAAPSAVPSLPTGAKLTPMQAAMRQKLVSARFRHLNQTLYTEPSAKALELFAQNPEMFEDYHLGFRQQVQVWPQNPVDTFISTIRAHGKVRVFSQKKTFKDQKRKGSAAEPDASVNGDITALPRTQGTCIIADIGCGDARLAQTLKDSGDGQKLQLKVLSYDLHSPSKLVTKADASSLPTADGSVDIAIFCLALMGTNWITFIEEAYRILHWKGELWIAEIKSRFGRVGRGNKPVEHSVGGKRKQAVLMKQQEKKKKEQEEVKEEQALAVIVDGVETKNEETDVGAFVDVLRRRGFVLKNGDASIDLGNKMFVKMEFVKTAQPTKGKNFKEADAAKPAERFKKTKAKFLEEDKDDVNTEDEAKTLKPCLYKIR